jgi:hypothetical protein
LKPRVLECGLIFFDKVFIHKKLFSFKIRYFAHISTNFNMNNYAKRKKQFARFPGLRRIARHVNKNGAARRFRGCNARPSDSPSPARPNCLPPAVRSNPAAARLTRSLPPHPPAGFPGGTYI